MVNEEGHVPEVCKKSIQAQAGDMQQAIPESFFREHSLRDLETWSPMRLEYAGRLAFPVAWSEGDTHLRRIGWEAALDRVGADLKSARPGETFFYASGRSSNEAAFLMQAFARAYGTQNVNNCSFYCHSASGVALGRIVGTGTSTLNLDDLDGADLAIVAGANPSSNHPRLIVKLAAMRKRGGTVIVVNPMRELGLLRFRIPSQVRSMVFGSDVASLYLQPHVGGDIAAFKAILKALIERGAVDREFTRDHVEGWDEVEADVRVESFATLYAASGLGAGEVAAAAEALAGAKRGVFLWAMGLTHHEHGVQNVAALANLALARGFLGKEGCGLLPIRGHSNVQGVGSVGFTPALKEAFSRGMEEVYGIAPSAEKGLDTYGSMVAAHEGRIRAAVLLGGNLFGSNPDRAWSSTAMQRIGTTAYVTTKLNEGHVHGRGREHVLFPVLARDEEKQSTTQESMFNWVRLSDGGNEGPEGEIRSEVEVVCDLAARVLPKGRFDFASLRSHRAIRDAIARIVPGYEAIGEIDDTKREFQIAGRVFHEPRFPTPSGRARAIVTPLPAFAPGPGEFRLMTLRSEGQFNTVVYEEEDLYRGNTRRDVVMMNEADGKRLGLAENDPVWVVTETGRMKVVASFVELPQGNLAMYYPEANAIVPRKLDPASGTPAFKSIVARLEV